MNNIKIYLYKEGPQGLSVNWKGAYSNTTTYQINDAVYWNSSSYICIAVTTGNLPSNTTYWALMSSGMGDFSGPSSSTANNFVSFANGDGKLGKDSGYNANSFEPKNANIQTHISSISNPHSVTKNQVGLGNVQNVDQTNPANITQSASYRFVTDTEKSTWNAKQDAIGYTPENVANKTSSFQVTPDNTKYPTEKLVKDSLDAKEDEANKKTTITSSDTDYPTCKAVETALAGKQPTGSYEVTTNKKTTLTDSDTDYPTTKAVNTGLSAKEDVANKSTSVSTDGSSDTKYPSAKAVKDYADGLVVGLLDYRGGYDASGNTYPTTGGSGTGGAVMKGDMWIISVAGTLGGEAVQVGDSIIANVDTPAQTASNWNHLNGNLSYVPEDVANKVTSISSGSTDTQYPSAKLTYDQLALKEDKSNKVTSISSSSTDTQYASAKLLYNQLALKENLSNRLSAFQGTPDNLHYITEKLAYDQLALKLNISSKATATDINTGTDNDKYVTPKAIEDSFIGLNPTLYSSYIESKGGVYNGDFSIVPTFVAEQTQTNWIDGSATGSATDNTYGWRITRSATAVSARFDQTVSHSGGTSLKLSTTDATGRLYASTYGGGVVPGVIKIKPSTIYKLTGWVKTNNVVASGVKIAAVVYDSAFSALSFPVTSYMPAGSSDWTQLSIVFTTGATADNIRINLENNAAGNVSDAWFDDIKLQEVSSLTPTNTLPETMGGIFQAQNTIAIDQSLDSGGAYTNTYALTDAINEGATHRQTFTPTKTKGYSIKIWPVAKGTGNWTVVVHDASNNLISSRTIANASIIEGEFNEWVFPSLFTAGQPYHFHVYSDGTGTLKANTTDDLETGSFIQYYSKLSEGMTIVSNGIRTNLMASSKDGLLGGSILDLDNGKYSLLSQFNTASLFSNIYSASAGGGTTAPVVVNGWDWANTLESLQSASDTTTRNIVWKIDTILPIKHLKITPTIFNNNVALGLVEISPDNSTWTTLWDLGASASAQSQGFDRDDFNGKTKFYIRISKSTENGYLRIDDLKIEADIDTSSIPLPTIYPLAVNQFNVPIKTSTAPARAYFRLNKYVNENNVMMPAIELTDSSGNPLGYGCVKQDNSQEASPCCKLLPTSTGYTGSGGTGSFDATGCILNDGEYMPITGTNYNFEIDYQLGTGTTAISAITKNIAYLSSNSQLADSTLDSSLMANFFLSVKQQGLATAIGDVREDIQEVKGGLTVVNDELDRLDGTMFVQTADKTIGNTTTETSIFDGGLGSRVLPAQSLKIGDTVRMRLMGYVSGTNGDASTIKVKVGASELVASTSNFPATVTGVFVEFLFEFTVRSIGSAGTVIGQGRSMFNASVGFGTPTVRGLQMVSGAVAIDTTKDNLVDITYTWGTARVGNTLTITNAIVEIKKQ